MKEETVAEKHLRGIVPHSDAWKAFECQNQTAYLHDDLIVVVGHRNGKVCGFIRKYLEKNRVFQQTPLVFSACVKILESETPNFLVTSSTTTDSDNLFNVLNERNG